MTRRATVPVRRAQRAFTLIELIGVLAIIAIMASILAPNMLRSLDRAASDAERVSLRALGEQSKRFLAETNQVPGAGAPPATPPVWCAQLSSYSELSVHDIWKNRRGSPRGFILESGTPTPRAILFSNIRPSDTLTLPSGTFATAAFEQMWNTADGSVPPTSSWNGWAAWNAQPRSHEHLIIERINFKTVTQTFTVTLNNTSGSSSGNSGNNGGGNGNSGNGNNGNGGGNSGNNGNSGNGGNSGGTPAVTASYRVVRATGAVAAVANIAAGASVSLGDLRVGDRLDLYAASGGANLNYSYVVSSSGRTIDFDGTQWTPK